MRHENEFCVCVYGSKRKNNFKIKIKHFKKRKQTQKKAPKNIFVSYERTKRKEKKNLFIYLLVNQ
jgi:hypothetical protein